jgi:hypothetical protein
VNKLTQSEFYYVNKQSAVIYIQQQIVYLLRHNFKHMKLNKHTYINI